MTLSAGTLRGCLAALSLAGALTLGAASAIDVRPRQALTTAGTQPWVTIDANGNRQTVTPSLVANGAATSTVSGFPGPLTPAPTADAPNGEGRFITCSDRSGTFAPFCTPADDVELEVGKSYYITWDPSFFEQQDDQVELQADLSNGRAGDDGFASVPVNLADGFYVWTILDSYLDGNQPANATLWFQFPTSLESVAREPGVTVQIVPRGGGGLVVSTLTVVLAAVFGALGLAIIAAALFFFCRRRRGGGEGYGIRKSKIQRVSGTATKDGVAFRMDDVRMMDIDREEPRRDFYRTQSQLRRGFSRFTFRR